MSVFLQIVYGVLGAAGFYALLVLVTWLVTRYDRPSWDR